MDITVTFLEMLSPPPLGKAARDGLVVVHAVRPTVGYYRFLSDAVGRPWQWFGRRGWSDAQLTALIHDPREEIHVLHVQGVPAGFAELDRRTEGEIELVYFGLMPEFIGLGLGRWFLQETVDRAWSYQPKRLWLHTDTLDHPAALPLYRKVGFEVYRQEVRSLESIPG
jgi:GNAT superfamily N-acetyltransferase